MIELESDPLARGPVAELAASRTMLELAERSLGRTLIRFSVPEPTMAFGRRDTRLVGYPEALGSAHRACFSPITRLVGGRAAAYHRHSLVMELAGSEVNPHGGSRHRFLAHAELIRDELIALGVDARVGEVPGEYCPGEFSVNARGAVKLMGAAQRVTRTGWILSAVIQVDDVESIREVTRDVYDDLQLEWSPQTVGSVAEEAPGIDVSTLRTLLRARYANAASEFVTMSASTLARRPH